MTILITGGSGYIGSHVIVDICNFNPKQKIISIDNYSNSYESVYSGLKSLIPNPGILTCYQVDICCLSFLKEVFEKHQDISIIIHLASYKSVSESQEEPLKYYNNNINGFLNILNMCQQYNINQFIFSSSASVYGKPKYLPMDESHPLEPISVYAKTKKICETILQDYAKANLDFSGIILRYFNPIGQHPSGLIPEKSCQSPNNLIPCILHNIENNIPTKIYGTDYPTPDGTAIRDYIYIGDIARAHSLVLSYFSEGIIILNLGTGCGTSVKDIIQMIEEDKNIKVETIEESRRDGDVSTMYTNYSLAKQILGWKPKYTVKEAIQTL